LTAASNVTQAPHVLVLLPTYNERENLERAVSAIFVAQPSFSVLIIDDASPDGTGELADRIAAEDSRVRVLHRAGKEGLAKAYLAGMRWALAAQPHFTHVFEMDADLSHDPGRLGALLSACIDDGADIAIGSRYVRGGGTEGWPWRRRMISRGGGLYAQLILGFAVRDWTAGFMCFSRRSLEMLLDQPIWAVGYGFQIEMKYRAYRLGLKLREVPITFIDRTAGESKMSKRIFVEALRLVWRLRATVRKSLPS
jgi:dolichol-phosphate mannosyltransferase